MQIYYRTPRTRLTWSTVSEWCDCARQLDRRRLSSKRSRDLETHACILPRSVIAAETSLEAIEDAIWLLRHGPIGMRRPQRGYRADHGTTPVLMDLQNRRAVLKRTLDVIATGDNWRAVHGSDTP